MTTEHEDYTVRSLTLETRPWEAYYVTVVQELPDGIARNEYRVVAAERLSVYHTGHYNVFELVHHLGVRNWNQHPDNFLSLEGAKEYIRQLHTNPHQTH